MTRYKPFTFLFFAAILLVYFSGCSSKDDTLNYKPTTINSTSIEFTSVDIPYAGSSVKIDGKIYTISRKTWEIDLKTGIERVAFEDGVGPDSIFAPSRIRFYNKELWVNSYKSNRFLYHFLNVTDAPPTLNVLRFDNALCFDDFQFISPNKIALTYTYWEDGLVRIYDLGTKKVEQQFSKPHVIDIMGKFNVNTASMYYYQDSLYIVESITPAIKVISLPDNSESEIQLSPPFFQPIPETYKVNKFDQNSHKAWMAGWTSVSNIMGSNGWLLVTYKRGYENKYYYELVNTKHLSKRLYIDETPNNVYEFKVEGNVAHLGVTEEKGENTLWKKEQVSLL